MFLSFFKEFDDNRIVEEAHICHKTDHLYSQDVDKFETGSKTYTDSNSPCFGGSNTRGFRHTTVVYATTVDYEVLPPPFIFDTDTEKIDNYKVKYS